MANTEYKRIVTKHGNGVATIPPSPSHDAGDWIETDIYEGELYIDDVTGFLYTNVGGVIIQLDAGAVPPASETEAGIAEIATQVETNNGADDARIVTPKKLAGWWTNLKTGVDQVISSIWTFEELRVQALGALFKTKIASGASSNQTWTIPGEGDQTFASQAYADALVVGLWDDRGNFDASVNAYPSSGGSGASGAILKGDIWTVSVGGVLPTGLNVAEGDTVRALVDTPGNIQANWAIAENNFGFIPENSANKDTSGGYVGLSGWSIKFRNLANTFTSLLQNAATAVRTYTFPDKDITVAGVSELPTSLMIMKSGAFVSTAVVAGTYHLQAQHNVAIASGAGSPAPPNLIYIDDANYPDRTGYTKKLRIKAICGVNAVAPGITFTVGLHPTTPSGGTSGNVEYDAEVVVSGSTVVFTTPGASSLTATNGTPFDFPTDGIYEMAVVTSGTTAINSGTHIQALLEVIYE